MLRGLPLFEEGLIRNCRVNGFSANESLTQWHSFHSPFGHIFDADIHWLKLTIIKVYSRDQ